MAITRARRHLIVIGKESLLSRNDQWKFIVDQAKGKFSNFLADKAKGGNGHKRVEEFIKECPKIKEAMKKFV